MLYTFLPSIRRIYLDAKFIKLSRFFFILIFVTHENRKCWSRGEIYATFRIFLFLLRFLRKLDSNVSESFLALLFIDPMLLPWREIPGSAILPFLLRKRSEIPMFIVMGPRETRENNLYTFGVGSDSEAEPESGLLAGEGGRKRERERRDKDGLGCACSLARAKRRYKPFRTVHIAARCHRGNTFSWVSPGRSCAERTAVVHGFFPIFIS